MSVLQWCEFNWIWKWCYPKRRLLSLLISVWMMAHSHSQGGHPTFWFLLAKQKPKQPWITLHHWQSHFTECLLCPTHNRLLIYVSSSLLPPLYSPCFLLLQMSWWRLTTLSTRPSTKHKTSNSLKTMQRESNSIIPPLPGTVLEEQSPLIRSLFLDCTCSFFFSTNKHIQRKKKNKKQKWKCESKT